MLQSARDSGLVGTVGLHELAGTHGSVIRSSVVPSILLPPTNDTVAVLVMQPHMLYIPAPWMSARR